MNIYLNVEIAARELDSKLLLATIAASKGHQVLVSDIKPIIEGIKKKALAPGIFHDKSLTPNKNKTSIHELFRRYGLIITSIDEENNLVNYGYEKFAKNRFSEKTINNTDAIFGWGLEDFETLKEIYSKNESKFHLTGSPRIDLLNKNFSNYWKDYSINLKKPYLLVVSNCQANNMKSFHHTIKHLKNAGFFNNDSAAFKKKFDEMSESYQRIYSFIEAVKYLAINNNQYEIVFRPHPAENIDSWKIFLDGIPNVHILREGSIAPWINNSFALLHNGCTTAIEATILGKKVITFMPFDLKHYTCEVPNSLGTKVKTLEELLKETKKTLSKSSQEKNIEIFKNDLQNLSKKIYIDENELAAEKIINIWEKIGEKKFSKNSNWTKFQIILGINDLKTKIANILRRLNLINSDLIKKDYKFPVLSEKEIKNKVQRIKKILKIEKEINCKLIGDRTILIK